MVTCTEMAVAIQYPPCQGGSSQHRGQAKQVAAHDVQVSEQPLALPAETIGLERMAGKGGVRTAEADGPEQAPTPVRQHALTGPDQKETQQEAAAEIDECHRKSCLEGCEVPSCLRASGRWR